MEKTCIYNMNVERKGNKRKDGDEAKTIIRINGIKNFCICRNQ